MENMFFMAETVIGIIVLFAFSKFVLNLIEVGERMEREESIQNSLDYASYKQERLMTMYEIIEGNTK